jgi:hypothetical protein
MLKIRRGISHAWVPLITRVNYLLKSLFLFSVTGQSSSSPLSTVYPVTHIWLLKEYSQSKGDCQLKEQV